MSTYPYQEAQTPERWQDEQMQKEIDRIAEKAMYAILSSAAPSPRMEKPKDVINTAYQYAISFVDTRERREGGGGPCRDCNERPRLAYGKGFGSYCRECKNERSKLYKRKERELFRGNS